MTPAVEVRLNGRKERAALALSRGLHYGDGIFRTCFINNFQIVDVEKQYEKLSADAEALKLTPDAVQASLAEARALAAGCARGVLKILLLRAGQARSYPPDNAAADRLLILYPPPAWSETFWTKGVRVMRCELRLSEQPAFAGIKHLNRLEQVRAAAELPPGIQEGLLCDGAEHPIGGTRTNLFWVKGGALYTPELSRCGVAGMMRGKVLELAAGQGITSRVGPWTWSQLEEAEEIFLTNSLIGIWPVHDLDGRAWSAPGPMTKLLMRVLAHPRLGA